MIDCCPQAARLEEMDTIQVGDVHSSMRVKHTFKKTKIAIAGKTIELKVKVLRKQLVNS